MTKAQAKKLDEVHAWTDFLVNRIAVNGDDGSAPVVGIEKILTHEHNLNKVQSKQICSLVDVTSGLAAKKKFRESFQAYLDTHGFVKFLLTPNRLKVLSGIVAILFFLMLIGIIPSTIFFDALKGLVRATTGIKIQ